MAAVVDSGPISIPVVADIDGVYINVVTGAAGVPAPAGWDINPYRTGTAGFNFFFANTPAGSGGCVVAAAACVALPDGSTVGPASTYQAGVVSGLNFRTAGDRNLGFRFQNEATGAVNYGYAIIRNSNNADPTLAGFPASVIRLVYDNAGVAIVLGPPPAADLALTQTNNATGSALLIGNTFEKTLTVTNSGPAAATGITVTDTLPAQLAFVSSNCGATAVGQTVTYTIASLANAAASSCVLTVRVATAGTITNTASITASTPPDPTPANNTSSLQIGPTGGGIAQVPVPALDRNMVLVLLGLVSAFGMLALRQRQV
ncbi:MAG: DUF11 domain-containing protein [Deltaproteobacteria bacterium]|nr:DUF11 domain-containing protein [Deltaproteobacteria bacterium]